MGSTLAVPPVMGFALTLFIGVALSMFSAIVITRTLLRLLGSRRMSKRLQLFIPLTPEMLLAREGR
jgi:preprotein translocase subunit SecD